MARILVADADADVRAAMRRALEVEGHEVVEASSVRGVFESIRSFDSGMVFLEGIFPDGSGSELCASLRRTGFSLPIVVVSTYNEGERRAALDAGANDCLIKPFGLRDLLRTVRKHVRDAS